MFCMKLHHDSVYAPANNKGFGETASKYRLARAFVGRLRDKYIADSFLSLIESAIRSFVSLLKTSVKSEQLVDPYS